MKGIPAAVKAMRFNITLQRQDAKRLNHLSRKKRVPRDSFITAYIDSWLTASKMRKSRDKDEIRINSEGDSLTVNTAVSRENPMLTFTWLINNVASHPVVTWLLEFGQTHCDHRGGVLYYFDKESRRHLERDVGRRVISRLSCYLDSYLVSTATDGNVITVGHRCKRFKWN